MGEACLETLRAQHPGFPGRNMPKGPCSPRQVLFFQRIRSLRSTLSEALVGAGYSVLEAAGPEQALALGASRRIDLVVSDIVMPRLSGPEVVRRLEVS